MICRNPDCRAEVNSKALFCGKCGVSVLDKCTVCECLLWEKPFCPKCGTLISEMPSKADADKNTHSSEEPVIEDQPVSKCLKCGKSFFGIGSLCGPCRKAEKQNGSWVGTIKEKTELMREWADTKVTDKKRAKQLIIIAFVVGICIAFTGVSGKITMERLSENMRNEGNFFGMNFIVHMIKDEIPAELRAQLIEQAGIYWPLIQAMAYYRELLTVGLILTFSSVIFWFLLDGKINDVKKMNLMPVFYVGVGWIVLVIVFSFMGMHSLSETFR